MLVLLGGDEGGGDKDPQSSGLNNGAGTGAARRWRRLTGRTSAGLFWMSWCTSRA